MTNNYRLPLPNEALRKRCFGCAKGLEARGEFKDLAENYGISTQEIISKAYHPYLYAKEGETPLDSNLEKIASEVNRRVLDHINSFPVGAINNQYED